MFRLLFISALIVLVIWLSWPHRHQPGHHRSSPETLSLAPL